MMDCVFANLTLPDKLRTNEVLVITLNGQVPNFFMRTIFDRSIKQLRAAGVEVEVFISWSANPINYLKLGLNFATPILNKADLLHAHWVKVHC